MTKICLGKNNRDKLELDFDKEKITFILLAGRTGSGKSIFHNHLYRELSQKYSKEEVGFVFLDMARVDFYNWDSEYLIKPVVSRSKEAIKALNELAELKGNKKIFVHIDECDMVYQDRSGLEEALEKLNGLSNICVVYSTSRLDQTYLGDWMSKFIDLKIVFSVASENDSNFLLGNNNASSFKAPGERILALIINSIIVSRFLTKRQDCYVIFTYDFL